MFVGQFESSRGVKEERGWERTETRTARTERERKREESTGRGRDTGRAMYASSLVPIEEI